MNLFKKIWITITDIFPKKQITDEKIVSTVENLIIATINRIDTEIQLLEEQKQKLPNVYQQFQKLKSKLNMKR